MVEIQAKGMMDGTGYAAEADHYYPYGALFGVSAMRGSAQPRKYGGKELERQLLALLVAMEN